jgi:hypothetical protein
LIGYYGGLRSIELRSIEFGKTFAGGEKSFDYDESGFWFSFERGKQRGLPEVSSFCIPRKQSDWTSTTTSRDRNPVDYDPASVIDLYLQLLELDLKSTRDQLSGGFFKSAHGKKGKFYRNVPMGKNLIERVGREFAEELFLPNPSTYTSHCWRRSCGTNASDSGINVTSLMLFMGWKTPKTAIGYVAKSRMASYNMSMFLCNVQRQNSDLDQIMEKAKPFIAPVKAKPSGKKKKSGKAESSELARTSTSEGEKTSSQFLKQLSSVRKSTSTARTIEERETEAANEEVVRAIDERREFEDGSVTESDMNDVSVIEEAESVYGHVVRSERGNNVELDSRVSSILSNLQHRGDLHLHFHFGNK